MHTGTPHTHLTSLKAATCALLLSALTPDAQPLTPDPCPPLQYIPRLLTHLLLISSLTPTSHEDQKPLVRVIEGTPLMVLALCHCAAPAEDTCSRPPPSRLPWLGRWWGVRGDGCVHGMAPAAMLSWCMTPEPTSTCGADDHQLIHLAMLHALSLHLPLHMLDDIGR